MSKTSEAVVFSTYLPFACSELIGVLLNMVEVRCNSIVCPTLVMHDEEAGDCVVLAIYSSEVGARQ